MVESRVVCASVKTAVIACMAGLVLGFAPDTHARVTRIVFGASTPAYGGISFGTVGPYEELDGTAWGEIDPNDPANAVIQDIQLAPRNRRGMVEYTTTVSILKPVSMSMSNHAMLFDIANRGRKVDPGFFNVGGTLANPQGDGFLEKEGFTLVWAGWQADLVQSNASGPLMTMSAPVAHEHHGRTITGVVRSEWTVTAPVGSQPILAESSSNTPGYAAVSTDNLHAVLTKRVHQNDPKEMIPNSQWTFADCVLPPVKGPPTGPLFPGTANPQKVCLNGGFDSNHIYELVYTAKDPIVMGLGMAAIRDVATFLRHERQDDARTHNPLAGQIKWSLLNGVSQSGRLLRTFLELGFNRDEQFGRVFDGMQPHIGSVRNYINIRFSQPGRLAGTQHTEKQYPGPEGPLTYGRSFDPFTREEGGLLDRCEATRTCPKIIHTMSDIEYWEASGAYDTVDPSGEHDVDIPDNVRIYQFASTQHGGFSPVAPLPQVSVPPGTGICEQLPNANSYTYNVRALLMALLNWVSKDIEPPPSSYATLRQGQLVTPDKLDFPAIPGVTPPTSQGGIWNTRRVYQRGAKYDAQDVSGIISIEPPLARHEYPTLLPQVDADGNDLGGLHTITLQAPLGTYTGWNVRANGFSEGDACDLTGGYIPFALDTSVRKLGDMRPTLVERYRDLNGYAAVVNRAAADLVSRGYLLSSDAPAAIASALNQAGQAGLK
jgi:hypothetical protein